MAFQMLTMAFQMAFQMLTMAFEMAFKTKLKKHMPFLITFFMTFEDFTKNMLKAFSKVVERHLPIAFGPFKTHFYKNKKKQCCLRPCLSQSFENFSKNRLRRDDSFGPKIIQIGAILAIFRPFEIFGNFSVP